ncbi:lysine transporter LysE [Candidatus Bathyarchaeota archaeon]|nr:MAG: lysine transporter LysE [Candidatus Bathyarchaeota archaeon]
MLTLLGVLVASFVAALVGALVPGPVFAVTVTESIKRGSIAGPFVVVGHLLAETVIIITAFFGLENLLKLESVKFGIGFIGGLTLLFMGVYILKTSKKVQVNFSTKTTTQTSYSPVFSGFLASCSNPYFFLWWVTPGIPLMYKSLEVAGFLGFVCFFIGHSLADLSWFGFIGYSTGKGRKVLNKNIIRLIICGGAASLMVLGVYFLLSTFKAI